MSNIGNLVDRTYKYLEPIDDLVVTQHYLLV